MELTLQERTAIAYMRAYKENNTRRKSFMLAIAAFALVVLDVILISGEVYPSGAGVVVFIVIMIATSFINYRIRKPEKAIAERILKEA